MVVVCFKTSNLRQSGLWEIDFLRVIYEVPSLILFNFGKKKKKKKLTRMWIVKTRILKFKTFTFLEHDEILLTHLMA